jgi:putative ABC transport system substrate-binding protein
MKRREFIAAAAALFVFPRLSLAQGTRRQIGWLGLNELPPTWQKAWLDGLRNNGWIEGKSLTIQYRFARSQDRFPALASELVALNPDLIICGNVQAAQALKSATTSIPIVFVGVADAVGIGLVQSLSHPGGNITGIATFVPGEFISKQIEILRELVPHAAKIAIVANPGNPIHRRVIAEDLPQAAQKFGLAFPVVEATTAGELSTAFASAETQHVDAIMPFGDALTLRHATQVAALAARHRLPAIYLSRSFATNTGLISYGPDQPDAWLRAGSYVDKILKGTKPSALPIEQPSKFELMINLKTAKELGLTVPSSLLARADDVIE